MSENKILKKEKKIKVQLIFIHWIHIKLKVMKFILCLTFN